MSINVTTTCPYCGVGCGVLAAVDENGAVSIAGDDGHPANAGRLCSKGAALGDTTGLDGRLLHPEVRGERTDWGTALDAVADGFREVIEQHGPDAVAFYVSGQLLTEDYYVANKLMKGFIGSGNIDTNSRLCMSSAVAGHVRAFGEDVVPGCYEDFEAADLIVLVGSNTAWCHPIVYRRIEAARAARPDLKLVVIDPQRTTTAEDADLHLPVAPGQDVALFNGLLAHLEAGGHIDSGFVDAHTEGAFAALAAARRSGDTAELARTTGIAEADLARFFDWFGATERTVTVFSQGVNQSSAGTDKVNAIINCHLLTGRIGRPGTGPFSITGQPNAMGGREVGGLANTLAAHRDFDAADSVATFWRAPQIAREPGLKAVDLFRAIGDGRVKAVWIMATNPLVSLPDADAARAALEACDLVVVSDCEGATDTLTCADIKLPATGWGEKDGTVTNSERCISRQRPFLPAPGEAKPDWWIIGEVARRLGHGDAFDYRSPHDIFVEHAALSAHDNDGRYAFDIGGLANLTRAEYDALEPLQWPVLEVIPSPPWTGERARERGCPDTLPSPPSPQSSPPVVGGRGSALSGTRRLFTNGVFPTETGRARFVAVTPRGPAHAPDADHPLMLNTGRVRDHWHTMTRTGRSARLSAHVDEPFAAVHPQEAQVFGLGDGALARLETEWGHMLARVRVDEGQARGSVFVPMHWNAQTAAAGRVGALVNPVVDPVSGEPEFKHTPLRMREFATCWHGFLLARTRPVLGEESDLDYWVLVRGEHFWRAELAAGEAVGDWAKRARRLLGATSPDADWLEFRDERAGAYRGALLVDDRLEACLFVAPEPPRLPARHWLGGLFAQDELSDADRMALLAGGPTESGADAGPPVCSCFGVSRAAIETAIRDQDLTTPAAIGDALGAGTNCGSCLPDLRRLIDSHNTTDDDATDTDPVAAQVH